MKNIPRILCYWYQEILTSRQKGAIVYSMCERTSASILLAVYFLSATEIRVHNLAYLHYF